jgi:hypothetical protein
LIEHLGRERYSPSSNLNKGILSKSSYLTFGGKELDDTSSLLQIKALFKVNWCVCANKRPISDGEIEVFKRYLVPQAKIKNEGKHVKKWLKWFEVRARREEARAREDP